MDPRNLTPMSLSFILKANSVSSEGTIKYTEMIVPAHQHKLCSRASAPSFMNLLSLSAASWKFMLLSTDTTKLGLPQYSTMANPMAVHVRITAVRK